MPALGRMFQQLKKKGRQRVTDLNSSVSLEFRETISVISNQINYERN